MFKETRGLIKKHRYTFTSLYKYCNFTEAPCKARVTIEHKTCILQSFSSGDLNAHEHERYTVDRVLL